MANVGYARVSSRGQSLEVQLEKLNHCDKIFKEVISGVDSNRPQLKECLTYLREGDALVITKLDRLARSTNHLWKISEQLNAKKVGLHVLDQRINTHTSTGRLLFNMLATIAQFETELRAERQMDGVKRALDNGVRFGRQFLLDNEQIQNLRQDRKNGMLIKDVMKKYDLSKVTVYRYLRGDR